TVSGAAARGRGRFPAADGAALPAAAGQSRGKVKNTVDIRDVSKRYGRVEAVRNVTFALPPGETVALVGHNGAGKTTLIKLMLGLIHPSAGTITVLDENPAAGESATRRRLGYLPENVSFNAALTGRELLSFYARLKGEAPKRAMPLLEQVGLAAAADRRGGTYSKGMRQRLGLAQALIGEPRSEEHTSELQSRENLVCRLLLEKKKQ